MRSFRQGTFRPQHAAYAAALIHSSETTEITSRKLVANNAGLLILPPNQTDAVKMQSAIRSGYMEFTERAPKRTHTKTAYAPNSFFSVDVTQRCSNLFQTRGQPAIVDKKRIQQG